MGERRGPDRVTLALLGIMVASAWLAVPLSLNFEIATHQTIWLALLTTVLAPLAWVTRLKYVLGWLTPVWLIQAGVSLYQWLAQDTFRVLGLANNQNAGAAFLLLGCIYLLNGNTRAKWLILPMVAAMPFTGSRWVGVVAAVVLLGIFVSRYVAWKYIALGIAATLAVVVSVGWDEAYQAFHRPNTLDVHLSGYPGQPDLPPSWIPRGFYDSGIHNVPWRMAHETGILSGLAWMGATAWGLWRRPRYDTRWWLLLTIALLSVMYYHVWIGPLGGFWWLLVRGKDKC